ncbi:MAG: quinolinate synthase NadA [Archaeoglobaceae archaeon]
MPNTCSKELQKEIIRLKEDKNAVILAHNYQIPEIQEVADFIGDSLELAREATKTDSDIIVFCGVDFMAETAAILNPDKKVIVPTMDAKCPMAAQLPAELVRETKARNPDIPFVIYVNSYASAKAEADICCTSANVVKVVERLDTDTVFLGPDANLAWFAETRTGKKVIPVPKDGFCYVHKAFSVEHVKEMKRKHPDAVIIVHPECDPDVQQKADYVGSTSQMLKFAKECDYEKIIVGTEIGLIERMRREIPDKTFIPLHEVVCRSMKLNTLENLLEALKYESNVVKVPENIAERAGKAIKRMVEIL